MSTKSKQGPKKPSAAEALTFNVSGLLGEPAGSIHEFEVAAPPLDLGPDLRQSRGVEGVLRLTRTNRGLLVQASLSTALTLECSRCLREIDYPVEIQIEEEALPSIDVVTGMPVDIAAEPDVLRLTGRHDLKLEGEVRDEIELAVPIAPLCRPDCPGLCPICGQELAAGPHDHPETEVDPRLEALRALLPRDEE